MENNSYIWKDNLIIALEIAIDKRVAQERHLGYSSDSTMVAAWKENLQALKVGKLEIRY